MWRAVLENHPASCRGVSLVSSREHASLQDHLRAIERPTVQGYLTHMKRTPLGPYSRPMPRVVGGSQGGGRFFMGEVPL